MALTDKEEVFCQVLAETGNQSKAYRAMYPNTKAKPESIYAEASKIAKKPYISLRVSELHDVIKEKRTKEFELTTERIALEIARLAYNDPRKAFNEDGSLKNVHDWPDEVAAAISSIKVTELKAGDDEVSTCLKEIKFWDKGKQLDLAARHKSMLDEKLNINLSITPSNELERLKELAKNAATS